MGELEDFLGYEIERGLTNKTLNIYQPHLITKITQGFNKDVKSLITFNTQLHRIRGLYGIKKQTQNIIGSTEEMHEWCRITTITFKTLTT